MSLRNPGCAFCGMPPLDGEPCCTSDFKRATMRKADAELADLRAYKERTEGRLVNLSAVVGHCGSATKEELRIFDLWRDPPQAEVQP